MMQGFKQKIALQMNKDTDYSSIFDHLRNKRPSRIFGRGLINIVEKEFYEMARKRLEKGKKEQQLQ